MKTHDSGDPLRSLALTSDSSGVLLGLALLSDSGGVLLGLALTSGSGGVFLLGLAVTSDSFCSHAAYHAPGAVLTPHCCVHAVSWPPGPCVSSPLRLR